MARALPNETAGSFPGARLGTIFRISPYSPSRIFLGLHYPSDVGAGVLIGSGFAAGVLGTLQATGSMDWIIRMGPLG